MGKWNMHLSSNYKTYLHKSLKTFWIQEFTSILYISYQTFGENVILLLLLFICIHVVTSCNNWFVQVCTGKIQSIQLLTYFGYTNYYTQQVFSFKKTIQRPIWVWCPLLKLKLILVVFGCIQSIISIHAMLLLTNVFKTIQINYRYKHFW